MKAIADPQSSAATAAGHWDQWQARRVAQPSGPFTDFGDHPEVVGRVCEHLFGSKETSFVDFIRQQLPDLAQSHVLSLCCGDGTFECALVEQGVFGRVTGMDISTARVAAGNARIAASTMPGGQSLAERVQLRCADVNQADYGQCLYDVVLAKSSLHHIEGLEHAFEQIRRCLKPGGRLVSIDFFGPTRFQWTDTQLALRSWFWRQRVPIELRCDDSGQPIPEIVRPSVQAMLEMDPSEAVRSGELYALLQQHFELHSDLALGGTLLNLLLYGDIVNRFDPANPAHNAVIREAVDWERQLIAQGMLPSDFRLIIGQPRA
jgi:SAM-dependent methyltransferase